MLGLAAALLLAAAQPASGDQAKAAPGAKPSTAEAPAQAAGQQLAFEPKTKVDGPTLQVILGQRATFSFDSKGLPKIEKVEDGQLAVAHAEGAVKEAFEAPDKGFVAAAVDGSAEKKATYLKIWNNTGEALEYRAVVLVMRKGGLMPAPVQTCAIAPGAVRVEAWPAPIVAVGLLRFKPAILATCK